ncbi:MAG: 3-oxoacyl-ACP synthase [Chloroflexi bacterium RBG_13_56_8]|nr:MAG: 3-oxoacyl-ACP synthase [Chloroflexi bacterium RBG_13_56_8]
MTNDDLAQILETSDGWIKSRTGIERRHIAGPGETTAQMAIEASRAALRVADVDPRDIDLVIVGTVTPNHIFPATACQVQDALGAVRAGAFDLNAVCSGFVYALVTGHQAIASGEHRLVLVVGADTMTKMVDWKDRSTCVLFGDGAAAVLLRASEGSAGVLATLLGSDGSGGDLLTVPAGGSAIPVSAETVERGLHYLRMDGQGVFRFATRVMAQATEQVVKKAGLKMQDIDLIIPHQANLRIISTAAKRLKLPMDRFVVNLQEYGNTSAASVPIGLCEAVESGRINSGQNLVLVSFGSGLTWAAVALRWGVTPSKAISPKYRIWWRWLLYRWAAIHRWLRQAPRRLMVRIIRTAEKQNGH